MAMGEVFEELNDIIGRVSSERLGREGEGFAPLSDDHVQLMKRIADHSSAGVALVLALRHIEYLEDIIDEDGLEEIAQQRAEQITEDLSRRLANVVFKLDKITDVAKRMRNQMISAGIQSRVLDELAEVVN